MRQLHVHLENDSCIAVAAFKELSGDVQHFAGNLKADAPMACKTETGALRTAERLALSKLGGVAFSPTGDPGWATMTTSRPSSSQRKLPSAFD